MAKHLPFTGTTGKVGNLTITENNIQEVLDDLENKTELILTMIGIKAEKYAKALCPVGTPESTGIKGYLGGTLRNSITFEVNDDELRVGSNVEYAPYVELGTGGQFVAPPDWIEVNVPKGRGLGKSSVRSRPYLRPAIEDHLNDYKNIIESELKK